MVAPVTISPHYSVLLHLLIFPIPASNPKPMMPNTKTEGSGTVTMSKLQLTNSL
jgi:hypothetical protein